MITSTTICVALICITILILAQMIRSTTAETLHEEIEELREEVGILMAANTCIETRTKAVEDDNKELNKKVTNANVARMR